MFDSDYGPYIVAAFAAVAFAGAVLCKLYRIPSAVHFGTKPGETPGLVAHAWLAAGPLAVTGGQSWDEYAVVACFVRP